MTGVIPSNDPQQWASAFISAVIDNPQARQEDDWLTDITAWFAGAIDAGRAESVTRVYFDQVIAGMSESMQEMRTTLARIENYVEVGPDE